MNARLDDRQYRDAIITMASRESSGWSITADDGWSFWIPPTAVTPRIGAAVRFYGLGIGHPVRGLVIDGIEVFYRTADQDEERHQEQTAQWKLDKRTAYEQGGEAKLDADFATLPPIFQQRMDGFRARGGEAWRIDHEPYEMSVCVDGARIARAPARPDDDAPAARAAVPEGGVMPVPDPVDVAMNAFREAKAEKLSLSEIFKRMSEALQRVRDTRNN